MDAPLANSNSRTRTAIRSAIIGLGVILVAGLVARYLVGSYKLGEVDSAILTMRILNDGERGFLQNHKSLGYSCRLSDLTSDPAIASGQRNGYVFEIRDCAVSPSVGPNKSYHLTARPLHKDMPAYCTDQTGVLRADYHGSVDACLNVGDLL